MTQKKNHSARSGFAPLITRRDVLALGVGSAAAEPTLSAKPRAAARDVFISGNDMMSHSSGD